jgi:histidyl-tRNA synthetase
MIDPRVASGLRDIPPSVMIPRERMLASFRQTFASFGFLPIETPHIERMEVLTGKGAGSDEVLRQIFDVTNKGGTPGELALRFDLTVPLARFIAKHVDTLGVPFKRYAIGSVFRGERPAKGRFREFVQCDFDTVGTTSYLADAETAHVIYSALSTAGVPAFTITLNHRKIFEGFLTALGVPDKTAQILRSVDKIKKIGSDGVRSELTKSSSNRESSAPSTEASTNHMMSPSYPALTDRQADAILEFVESGSGLNVNWYSLTGSSETNPIAADGIMILEKIRQYLKAVGVPDECVEINLGLARGLDYYTGTVFETTVNGWEKFGSISSGGRYDNLASLFTERRLPGVGASIGLDRLLALMEEAGWLTGISTTAPVLVTNFPGVDAEIPVKLAADLRRAGIGAEVFPDNLPIGKQLGYGSTRGYKLAVIVGPAERDGKSFNLRDLTTRQEQPGIPQKDVVEFVKSALAVAAEAGP